ncbi:MAG: FlgD immunoglobulin-like domain containing protein [Candidatus Eiseniibacteriota bacterium]
MRVIPFRRIPSRAFAAILVCWTSAGAATGRVDPLTGETAWSVAMHMHGSFSEGSGSMEWHTDLADQAGVDVIWWTDHDWRIAHTKHMGRYDFEAAFIDTVDNRVEEPDDAYPGEFRYWEPAAPLHDYLSYSLVDSVKFEGEKSLRLSVEQTFPGPIFGKGYMAQRTSAFQHIYSLAGRIQLRFAMKPEALDPIDSRFVVQVSLSQRPTTQNIFRWVAGTMDGEGPNTFVLPHTVGVWNAYTLNITNGAIIFFTSGGADSVRGEDNALYDVRIGLETRNEYVPVVFFDDYRVDSDSTMTGDDLLDRQRAMAAYYEGTYPSVRHLIGSEISLFNGQPHLNAFAPNHALIDYGSHVGSDSIYYAIDQVRAQGGAVSLNHVFGVSIYGDTTETPAHKAARVAANQAQLVGNRCWGVDLLEVGYRSRGGMDLQQHFSLWDALTANGVFVTGNGVTDSHGPLLFAGWGPHQPGNGNYENNFATWLYAPVIDEAELVEAMRSGRAFFGDPYAFDGTVDLATPDGLRMGQVVLTDRPAEEVIVSASGVPADVQVRLLQMEIREDSPVPYLVPTVLRDEMLAGTVSGGGFSDTVSIDVTLPSYLRLELRGALGEELAFSNPLHFVKTVPSLGIPGPRAGAHLGETTLLEAKGLTLTAALLNPGPPTQLFLDGDEDPPGLGEIRVATGALGGPSLVTGTASWSWQDGVFTAQGFSGGASSIVVSWGPVAAGEVAVLPAEVQLEPGRPNPFGEGFRASFSLPARDRVRLDVYDVAGRRVRRLIDGERGAGRHEAVWDGRDESGRLVANGIYLLRLDTGERTLTTRAVKIR